MTRIAIFLILIMSFSCQNDSQESSNKDVQANQPSAATAALPGLPLETIQYLWENCDYIDFLFYELPISMSLNEKSSIQYALRHISADAARLDPNCRAIGRVFYQVKGENFLEADIFFQQGCTYFKFLKDNKPVFANYMTDDGIKYMNENIERGQEMQRNIQQQGQ
ncbi:MAG: hypothetical protein NXI23_00880 [Bacteroidetes bacterium]|jgi:hypothetical protein|nr:hypothetical protein [Bacteroidota bacterium]MDF1863863.1 hypothetical protein [Saprospiraceae bacterium]